MSSSSWKTTGWSPMPQTYNLPRRGQPGPALPQVSLQSFICHDGSIMTVECPYFSKFPVNKIAVWFMFIASLHSYKLYFYWLFTKKVEYLTLLKRTPPSSAMSPRSRISSKATCCGSKWQKFTWPNTAGSPWSTITSTNSWTEQQRPRSKADEMETPW